MLEIIILGTNSYFKTHAGTPSGSVGGTEGSSVSSAGVANQQPGQSVIAQSDHRIETSSASTIPPPSLTPGAISAAVKTELNLGLTKTEIAEHSRSTPAPDPVSLKNIGEIQ